MKGLWKYLSPFAPDISGAVEVLFKMNGLIVIIDAGGCTGNVCGFDEPRWKSEKSAIFSAGLRDLDAILGRDEAMMKKIGDVLGVMEDPSFLALVGTPVPSVIATDYQALRRMGERKFGITTLTMQTTGMELYDKGQERAYLELVKTYAKLGESRRQYDGTDSCVTELDASSAEGELTESLVNSERMHMRECECTCPETDGLLSYMRPIGIFGATPMDLLDFDTTDTIKDRAACCGGQAIVFGESVRDFEEAASFRENLVISPSGLAAASYMEKKYGIPYTVRYPLPKGFELAGLRQDEIEGKKILIVHQAVLAETIREKMERVSDSVEVDTATFFMPFAKCRTLPEEDDFIKLVADGNYDIIIGDPMLRRALRGWSGRFVELAQFSVSGVEKQ